MAGNQGDSDDQVSKIHTAPPETNGDATVPAYRWKRRLLASTPLNTKWFCDPQLVSKPSAFSRTGRQTFLKLESEVPPLEDRIRVIEIRDCLLSPRCHDNPAVCGRRCPAHRSRPQCVNRASSRAPVT